MTMALEWLIPLSYDNSAPHKNIRFYRGGEVAAHLSDDSTSTRQVHGQVGV